MISKILNPSLCLSSYKYDGFLWATRTIVLGVSISCKSGQCLLMQNKFWVPVVVQPLTRVWLFAIPWTAAGQVSLSFTISWSLLKLMSIESMMPSNHLIFCCPPSPILNVSQHQGLFKWVSSSHQMAKVLELQDQSFQWIFRVDFL